MASYHSLMTFSPNGEYFAHTCPDGCLNIWETSTNILKQEYTPSSHLHATCTSLCWSPSSRLHAAKSAKKSRLSMNSSLDHLQLIAMGTLTGDVMLYSFINADVYTFLNGHTAAVKDVCWHIASCTLFTCSSDQHIIMWDVTSGKIKLKWKAGKMTIYSLCAIDKDNLLCAGTSIQWWDVKQKTVLKNFSGHASPILRMFPLPAENQQKIAYFLSSAVGERVINAWQLNENQTKGAVASFVCSSEPSNIDLTMQNGEPLNLSVVTKDGLFHLFSHTLNGRLKKPLLPTFTVQIASKAKVPSAKPTPVPILAANLSSGLESCILVYGTFTRPVFERIALSTNSKDLYLIRNLSVSSISMQKSVSKVKQTEKPSNLKVLAPGLMTATRISGKKRKQKQENIKQELPMEEHLKFLGLSKDPENVDAEPAAQVDSMVQLLTQGLQSKDNDMLNCVFQKSSEEVIRTTVQKLPLPTILLSLRELFIRINKQEHRKNPCLKWLYGLVSIHLPYLMSCCDVVDYLGPISQLIEARVQNFDKMSQLSGLIKVLMSQTEPMVPSFDTALNRPLVEYRSDSDKSEGGVDFDEENAFEKEVGVPAHSEEPPEYDVESSDAESDTEM